MLRKLLEKYKTKVSTNRPVGTPQDILAKACDYAPERWDGLTRYCEEGYYDIDKGGTLQGG